MSAADRVLRNNTRLEEANLMEYTENIKAKTYWMLIIGVIVITSILFFIWKPILKYLERDYILSRRAYIHLPIDILMYNAHIQQVLKISDV